MQILVLIYPHDRKSMNTPLMILDIVECVAFRMKNSRSLPSRPKKKVRNSDLSKNQNHPIAR